MQSTCRLWENGFHCSGTRGDNRSTLSARVPPLVRADRNLPAPDAAPVLGGAPGATPRVHDTDDLPTGPGLRLWG
jgi:hypothetical protein